MISAQSPSPLSAAQKASYLPRHISNLPYEYFTMGCLEHLRRSPRDVHVTERQLLCWCYTHAHARENKIPISEFYMHKIIGHVVWEMFPGKNRWKIQCVPKRENRQRDKQKSEITFLINFINSVGLNRKKNRNTYSLFTKWLSKCVNLYLFYTPHPSTADNIFNSM